MTLKIGELFAGYGGLGMGVQAAIGGDVVWFSEFDKGPSKILAHRFPGIPNHGDITKIDWSQVEPVDVLTGGSPCQDLSHAGKRAGMSEGTRSNLWVAMREAIATLRPSLVIWENVRGAYSAGADSELEPCAGCVGDGSGVHLRALGRVLGDLADLGYDAQWHGLRAADVGAPHGRFRVFLVAEPSGLRRGQGWSAEPREAEGRRASADIAGRGNAPLTVLPTPTTRDHKDHTIRREPHRPDDTDTLARALTVLLPTPRAGDGEKGGPNQRGSSGDLMLPSAVQLLPTPEAARNGNTPENHLSRKPGRTVVTNLDVLAAGGLLPTPRSTRGGSTTETAYGFGGSRSDENRPQGEVVIDSASWGQYAAAIQRWESLTRPAPEPTEVGPKGSPRLSARFSEWMMGLPDGWITDVPGITRNEALKACGNGVVPQQAAAALRLMTGIRDLSGIGESTEYPTGYGCEVCM